MMKGQADMTEYLVLVIMIMLIAFIAVIMIFGFQILNIGSGQSASTERRALFMLEAFSASSMLGNTDFPKGTVFEDSKLTVATCDWLSSMLGQGWWAEARVITDKSRCGQEQPWLKNKCLQDLRKVEGTVCTKQNYPSCSIWRFCQQSEKMVFMSMPVNIYRKLNGTMELGVLTIGVPSGG